MVIQPLSTRLIKPKIFVLISPTDAAPQFLQKLEIHLIAIDSISTAKKNSNPDKGQPCLTPQCNSNQFDAYPLLNVQLVIFVYKILTQDWKL